MISSSHSQLNRATWRHDIIKQKLTNEISFEVGGDDDKDDVYIFCWVRTSEWIRQRVIYYLTARIMLPITAAKQEGKQNNLLETVRVRISVKIKIG